MAEPETLRETMDVGAEASGEALRREANFVERSRLFPENTAVDGRKESLGGESCGASWPLPRVS